MKPDQENSTLMIIFFHVGKLLLFKEELVLSAIRYLFTLWNGLNRILCEAWGHSPILVSSHCVFLPFFDYSLMYWFLCSSPLLLLAVSHPSLFGYVTLGYVGGRWMVVHLLAFIRRVCAAVVSRNFIWDPLLYLKSTFSPTLNDLSGN